MVLSRFPRRIGVVISLLPALCTGLPGSAQTRTARPQITKPIEGSALLALRGNVHPLARPEFDRGPAPLSLRADRMVLVLKRTPLQEERLRQYLASLEDRNSPNYHRFLTPEQFAAQYGPAPEDVEKIATWLNGQGFSVNHVARSNMSIEFSGSVNQVEIAFHTQIHRFAVNGQEHVANTTNPMIPSALSAVVAGVSPLNDFYPRPQAVHGPSAQWDAAEKRFVPQLTVSISSTPYLFVSPGDVATIYNAPTSLNQRLQSGQAAYDGTGVSIGIVTSGGVNIANVQNYRALFKLPPANVSVVMDGNSPGSGNDTESTLDAEVAGAIAPGAKLVYYQAADTTFQSGVMLAILRAIDDNTVNILNVSYGSCELSQGAAGNAEILNAWEQAAAQGIAVTVSSGDAGSAGCDNPDTQTAAMRGFGVNALASTPYTVAVGGTDFAVLRNNYSTYASTTNSGNYTSALGYIPETVWNDSPVNNGSASANQPTQDSAGNTNILAGGGGASNAGVYDATGNALGGYPKPLWQQEFETSSGIAADKMRDVPDVSLFAANGMNGALWATCGDNDCTGANPTISGVGGTSASAPAFAGVLALINQKIGVGARLGQPNWVLYRLAQSHPEAFHRADGNNAVVCAPGTPNCGANGFLSGYDSRNTYNMATGLGSVDIASLINQWTSVGRIQTTTSLALGATTFQHGQPIAMSIAVNPSAATGSVAIGTDLSTRGRFSGDSQWNTALANGQASAMWGGFPGGTYNVYASYGGDGSYGGSVSQPQLITVAPEDSVVRLAVTGPDGTGKLSSLAGRTITYGTYVSVDAQPIGRSQAGNRNPTADATGTVTFNDTAAQQPAQGSGMLDATGNAEFPLHYPGAGTHAVTASYSGDDSYNPGTSAAITFIVQKAVTISSVSTSASSIDSGTVLVTGTIRPGTASQAPPPNGTVIFTDATTGAVLGTAVLSAEHDPTTGASMSAGSIEVPVTQLSMGNNNVVATYSGDANFLASAASVPATVACTAGCGSGMGQTIGLSISQANPAAATGNGIANTSTTIVSVVPGGGFTGAVNLSCSLTGSKSGDANIPTCSFNHATVTITNTQSVQSTLTVASTPGAAITASDTGGAAAHFVARGGAVLACILLFGLRRRRVIAVFRVLLCCVALGAMLGGVTGCGGSASQNPNTTGTSASAATTPDQYTVTVRAVDAATGMITAQDSFTIAVN